MGLRRVHAGVRITIEELVQERDEALLSMDEEKIRAYFLKYNGTDMPSDPFMFWAIVHKARTGSLNLPMWERAASKGALRNFGMDSLDDGDVFPPTTIDADNRYRVQLALFIFHLEGYVKEEHFK